MDQPTPLPSRQALITTDVAQVSSSEGGMNLSPSSASSALLPLLLILLALFVLPRSSHHLRR